MKIAKDKNLQQNKIKKNEDSFWGFPFFSLERECNGVLSFGNMCRSIFRFFPLGIVLIVRDRWFYCKVKEEKVDERYIS